MTLHHLIEELIKSQKARLIELEKKYEMMSKELRRIFTELVREVYDIQSSNKSSLVKRYPKTCRGLFRHSRVFRGMILSNRASMVLGGEQGAL